MDEILKCAWQFKWKLLSSTFLSHTAAMLRTVKSSWRIVRSVQTVSIANSPYSEHIRSMHLIITSGHSVLRFVRSTTQARLGPWQPLLQNVNRQSLNNSYNITTKQVMKLDTLKWNKQNKNDWMVKKDQGKTERLSEIKEMRTTRNYPGRVGWENLWLFASRAILQVSL